MSRLRISLVAVTLGCLVSHRAFGQDDPYPPSSRVAGSQKPATSPRPSEVDPKRDEQDLLNQGKTRPATDGGVPSNPREVYAEDWWGRARPVFEIHGYFRTRGEFFHNLSLGRRDAPGNGEYSLYPNPLDHSYTDLKGALHDVNLCGGGTSRCEDRSQASANMRFRIAPELHISDNLRILSQIDALDNLVLGSTPDAYTLRPGGSGWQSGGTNGYAPYGFQSTTQGPPTAGVNGFRNSIDVKRVWGEYQTPVGQLRFGRMPFHWGLGMLFSGGDHIDSDYQTNMDRIMFTTGIKSMDLYFGGSWDFVSTGPSNASPWDVYGGQPLNNANLANVDQWSLFVARRTHPATQRLRLAKGGLVVNGGLYAQLRKQQLDVKVGETPLTGVSDQPGKQNGFEYRGAKAILPDLWLQLLWDKFRVEAEFATMQGEIGSSYISTDSVPIRSYGVATQTEYRAMEDKLRLHFGFGWSSGDPWQRSLNPAPGEAQTELNRRGPMSMFRMNPDYRVDMIFFRNILSRVQGAYYFRPSVEYDFSRNPNGQRFGGGATIIWSRASEFVQTPGNRRDLGVEVNLQLYYQAKDGSLNDDPNKIGGFYSMLQYGVFFPLGGLTYLSDEQNQARSLGLPSLELSAAQAVRLFLGIAY